MLQISDNLKFQLKKIALIGGLSFVFFFGTFYVVSLVDLDKITSNNASLEQPVNETKLDDQELQKRAGMDHINLADFNDWARVNNLSGDNIYDGDPDGDGLPNYLEYIHGTDPNNPDTDGDGFSDSREIANGYDPDAKGEAMTIVFIEIDKIKVHAPMVWSKTDQEDGMMNDLENGLSHFVKTAAPGQNGNMIISGHSSNYIWAKGNFNHVFKNLGDLEIGDQIVARTIQRNGRVIDYKYQVSDKFVTMSDDERIFAVTDAPTLTLSTCWPIGTNLKRLIIKANLVK